MAERPGRVRGRDLGEALDGQPSVQAARQEQREPRAYPGDPVRVPLAIGGELSDGPRPLLAVIGPHRVKRPVRDRLPERFLMAGRTKRGAYEIALGIVLPVMAVIEQQVMQADFGAGGRRSAPARESHLLE